MTQNQYIINRLLHFGMFVWLLLFSRRGWKIWTPITYHRKQLPQRLKVKVYHLQNGLLLPSLTHIHSGASCKRSMVAWDIWLTYFETLDTVSQLGRQRSALFGKRKKHLFPMTIMMFHVASSMSCIFVNTQVIPSPKSSGLGTIRLCVKPACLRV